MSKKRKTKHDDYTWHVELRDSFNWDSDNEKLSQGFDSEKEAAEWARDYARRHQITSGPKSLTNVLVVSSAGHSYSV